LRASRSSSTETLSMSNGSPLAFEGVGVKVGGAGLFAAGRERGARGTKGSTIAPIVWEGGRRIAGFEGVDFLMICGSRKVGMLGRTVEGGVGVGRRGKGIDGGLLFPGVAEDGRFIRACTVDDPRLDN